MNKLSTFILALALGVGIIAGCSKDPEVDVSQKTCMPAMRKNGENIESTYSYDANSLLTEIQNYSFGKVFQKMKFIRNSDGAIEKINSTNGTDDLQTIFKISYTTKGAVSKVEKYSWSEADKKETFRVSYVPTYNDNGITLKKLDLHLPSDIDPEKPGQTYEFAYDERNNPTEIKELDNNSFKDGKQVVKSTATHTYDTKKGFYAKLGIPVGVLGLDDLTYIAVNNPLSYKRTFTTSAPTVSKVYAYEYKEDFPSKMTTTKDKESPVILTVDANCK